MQQKIYIRPVGLLYGAAARQALEDKEALPLAGGPLAFTAAEIAEGEAGKAKRRVLSIDELKGMTDGAVATRLEHITSAREPIAGLSLDQPRIMGVVNVTPDSFSDGGLYDNTDVAVSRGATLMNEGAALLDIGGESTRPGADPVEAKAEAERILPVIAELRGVRAVISADTRKSALMRKAADNGAQMLNDVSALTHDEDSVKVAADTGLPVVLMHAQGDPRTMQDAPRYDDVVLDVFDFLEARIAACVKAGIARELLVADPGIGFGKTLEHNLALLESLSIFHGLGTAVLVGSSRKRFIGALTGDESPRDRLTGSVAAVLAAAAQGVQLHRVHDVGETVKALTLWEAAMHGKATLSV